MVSAHEWCPGRVPALWQTAWLSLGSSGLAAFYHLVAAVASPTMCPHLQIVWLCVQRKRHVWPSPTMAATSAVPQAPLSQQARRQATAGECV